jgi:hypothetical protein
VRQGELDGAAVPVHKSQILLTLLVIVAKLAKSIESIEKLNASVS